MSEANRSQTGVQERSPVPHACGYVEWSFEAEVEGQQGPVGTELSARSRVAHARLWSALGADGFEVLDAYVLRKGPALMCVRVRISRLLSFG